MEDLNKIKKSGDIGKICGAALYIVSAAMLIYSFYLCFSPDIWYDELFSIEFARRPISEMIKLTAADVHPPLYYVIVHIAFSFGGITAAKAASVLPFAILFVYAVAVIGKRYGVLTGGLFSASVMAMPGISEYIVEIRMYSWCLLFITAMCIHALPFMEADPDKQIKGLKWGKAFPIFAYGLMACYTQYYSAVAVFAIYMVLLVFSVRKNIYQLGILLISANATVVAYFPWIGVVLSQARTVSDSYWIQPLSIRSLGGIIKYIMKSSFANDKLNVIIAVVLTVMVAAAVLGNIRDIYMWLCFMPLIGIIIFGFAASILLRPIFVYRYMVPGMGAMWLGVLVAVHNAVNCISLEQNQNAKTEGSGHSAIDMKSGTDNRSGLCRVLGYSAIILASLMVVIAVRDFWAFRGNELYKRINMEQAKEMLSGIASGETGGQTVIISNFDHVTSLTSYYLNEDISGIRGAGEKTVPVLLYEAETEPLIQSMVPGVGTVSGAEDIADLIRDGNKVLFFGSFNSREELVKEWADTAGITAVNTGSYLMERYWVDVFELNYLK